MAEPPELVNGDGWISDESDFLGTELPDPTDTLLKHPNPSTNPTQATTASAQNGKTASSTLILGNTLVMTVST